jgi:O-antigen/teichoic acid export membrane protein
MFNRGLGNTVISLADRAYLRIFGSRMGPEARRFLEEFSFVAVGTAASVALSFSFSILAGRFLGPSGFGEFTIIQSVAAFLSFAMSLGFTTAMVKYTAEDADPERRARVISTTYFLVLACSATAALVYAVLAPRLSKVFSIQTDLFYLSIALAALYAYQALATNTLRAVGRMKTLAFVQPLTGFIMVLAFLLFAWRHAVSSLSGVFSLYLAYGVTAFVVVALFARRYLRFHLDWAWAKKLGAYGVFAAVGGLASVFYANTDRIMLNRYMDISDVGIYKAYVMASISIMGTVFEVFNIVFFPSSSRYRDKMAIFKSIHKVVPYWIVLGFPAAMLCQFIILKLLGPQYPISLAWIALFAGASVVWVIDGVYGWFFNSIGAKGMRLSAIAAVASAVTNIGFNLLLIPIAGIAGAGTSIILSLLVGVAITLVFGKRYLAAGTYDSGSR